MSIKQYLQASFFGVTLFAFYSADVKAAPAVLGIVGNAQVGVNFLSFDVLPQGAPFLPPPGYGVFEVTVPTFGIFSTVIPGEFGAIQSINSTLEPAGKLLSPAFQFMTFYTAASNLQVFLTELLPPSPGASSPLFLQDTTNGAVISFNAFGYVLNTNDGTQVPFQATYSSIFNGTTVAQLLRNLIIPTPFSGTLSLTPTPEPSSTILIGIGLIPASLFMRLRCSTRL